MSGTKALPVAESTKRYNLSQALLGLGDDQLRRKGQQNGWVQRRGKKWHIFYREFVGTEDGKAVWRPTSRVVGDAAGPEKISKATALSEGRRLYVNKANGLTITAGGLATVEQFVEARYRPDHIEKLRSGTADDYESIIRLHILPSLGHCQLRDVTRAMVQVVINSKDKSGLSGQRVHHIRNVLSSIFRHARRMNYISGELPTFDVIMPEVNAQERPALSDEQMELLLLHVREARLRIAIRLMARLGLRAGEMAGLRWEAVNLTSEVQWLAGDILAPGQMWIREQYTRNEFSEVKTKKSNRRIPLPSDMLTMLIDWKSHSKFTNPDHTVFASRAGTPLDHHNVLARTIKPACIKAGIPWASWHNLRHTFQTAADEVMSVHESMAILGHASARTTGKYTHVKQSTLRDRLESMPVKGLEN